MKRPHLNDVSRLFEDAQTNPELAKALGEALGDLKEMAETAQDFGYNVTANDIFEHIKKEWMGTPANDGGGHVTTRAFGEESRRPGGPRPPGTATTLAVGEEGSRPRPIDPGSVTQAEGESGRPNPPPRTTQAVGEDGKPPTKTTMRVGEEGGRPVTSAAIGEEGGRKR